MTDARDTNLEKDRRVARIGVSNKGAVPSRPGRFPIQNTIQGSRTEVARASRSKASHHRQSRRPRQAVGRAAGVLGHRFAYRTVHHFLLPASLASTETTRQGHAAPRPSSRTRTAPQTVFHLASVSSGRNTNGGCDTRYALVRSG